jgi:hypothetical protein
VASPTASLKGHAAGESIKRTVGGADAVVQEVEHGAVRAVDGGQRALDEVPLVICVVRDVRVCVLQPRVQHQPHVHKRVGQEVQAAHLCSVHSIHPARWRRSILHTRGLRTADGKDAAKQGRCGVC